MKKLFEELSIKSEIKNAINELGITEMTEIQELAIPVMIEGKDFIAQAQTGTGKTFAFAVPIIEKIEIKNKNIQALVLCPTRELALQVYNEFLKLVKFSSRINVGAIVGGESYDRQFKTLAKKPHIIIGTPGRIIDHMNRNTIDLSNLNILTFDEADEMLKMGFQEDIEFILEKTPEDRQTVLFSATIPAPIRSIAKKYQKDAEIIKVENKNLTVDAIMQAYYVVKKGDKINLLLRILDLETINSAIVFANTKKEVDEITEVLRKNDYSADSLHGDLKQAQRNYVTNLFRNKELKVLVATDVAARGLDISNVELVLNYELPHENEVYVHRIGRTGRAGASGKAYSMLTPRTEFKINELQSFTKSKIQRYEIPSISTVKNSRIGKFIEVLETEVRNNTKKNDKIIDIFVNRGIDKDDLLNTLIAKYIPLDKVYEDIEVVQSKNTRSNNSNKNRPSSLAAGYSVFKINLGRKDQVTPIFLLELLGSKLDIYGKNIGDIKIHDKYTTFQLNERSANKAKNKKFKAKNKDIKIEEV